MKLSRYRLAAQLGSGCDGVRYRAVDAADGVAVEVVMLNPHPEDRDRREALERRLRTAALLRHPTARPILELGLDHDPPFLVHGAAGERTLLDLAPGPGAASLDGPSLLLEGVAAAHRLGLAHGRLEPAAITIDDRGRWLVDWTGLELGRGAEHTGSADALESPGSGRVGPCHAGDVYDLGGVLHWYATGRLLEEPGFGSIEDPGLAAVVRDMRAADPADRPTAREVARRLAALRDSLVATGVFEDSRELVGTLVSSDATSRTLESSSTAFTPDREQLGRFRLIEKIGQGGMGAVYRGTDLADGSTVAVKVLSPTWAERPESLRRFLKEARLLSEVNNPFVTNLIEMNQDEGIYFLALEFVAGEHVGNLLDRRGRLDERTALTIMADVARGLSTAHERGIIHRDVKPQNILLVAPDDGHSPLRVKLTDFGLARHVVESESLHLTQTGAILGTPLYMSPEQCGGAGPIDARSDVYAMGATLFHLLAGRPPFQGPTPLSLVMMHQKEPPPDLASVVPGVSDAVSRVVARSLAKLPEARYPDAAAFLEDLERLLRGQPTGLAAHPLIPDGDARDVIRVDVRLELDSPPRRLWPHVSNTERLNRAIGLPAVRYRLEPAEDEGPVRRFGQFRKAGITATWREHAFEWIEARRMGVLREYSQGPFRWLISTVELEANAAGGTLLTHTVRVAPRNLFGRTVAAVEVGIKGRRALEAVYRRIDAAESGKLGSGPSADPFEPPADLGREQRARIERLLDRLVGRGVAPEVAEALGDFLAHAPAQEVARIRPLALARRLGLDPDATVAACLSAAVEGGLILLWDLLCPVCRIPSQVIESLRSLQDHGRCDACNLDFDLDFAGSVEMIFRAHPEIRDTELGIFCVGGPSHSPHVAAQARVAPGERFALELDLAEGAYRLRGPQLAQAIDFRVDPQASLRRWDLDLACGLEVADAWSLAPGGQVICLHNDTGAELIVRIERTASRDDALTAARASSLDIFRRLFPGEILNPGQLVSLASVTLLVTEPCIDHALYERLGDARAFEQLHRHLRQVEERVRRAGGALVKTVHEGAVATFHDVDAAVRVALELSGLTPGDGPGLRVAVHRGPVMVATFNDHLDYFGTTAHLAARLPALAEPGGVVLTPSVASDPQVATLLHQLGLDAPVLELELAGLPEGFVHRLRRSPAHA